MTTIEFLTLIALIMGPIIAVVISYFITKWQEKRNQQIKIFLTLMETRKKIPMPESFVNSLNTIDIVFRGNKKIMEARKELLNSQNKLPYFEAETYNKRLLDLLDAISKSLGFKIKQTDLDTPFVQFTVDLEGTQENK